MMSATDTGMRSMRATSTPPCTSARTTSAALFVPSHGTTRAKPAPRAVSPGQLCGFGEHSPLEELTQRGHHVTAQPGAEAVAREVRAEVGRASHGQQPPAIQHTHAVAQLHGFVGAVRRQDHGATRLLPHEARHEPPELPRRDRIEAARRLVEQQHARSAQQRTRDQEPLAHPDENSPTIFSPVSVISTSSSTSLMRAVRAAPRRPSSAAK